MGKKKYEKIVDEPGYEPLVSIFKKDKSSSVSVFDLEQLDDAAFEAHKKAVAEEEARRKDEKEKKTLKNVTPVFYNKKSARNMTVIPVESADFVAIAAKNVEEPENTLTLCLASYNDEGQFIKILSPEETKKYQKYFK